MASSVVYVAVLNDALAPIQVAGTAFTPSIPFVSPPRQGLEDRVLHLWEMNVEQGTTITVSAPGLTPATVNTYLPNSPFVGTTKVSPIQAILSAPFSGASGLVADAQLQDGDVLVFYPADLTGAAIDAATGGYGYSHCGLACVRPEWGYVMVDVDNTQQPTPQVEEAPLATALQRGHVGIRFGPTESQAEWVCTCAFKKIGDLEFSFSGGVLTVDLCTTLILNCMSSASFDLDALGLGGAVVSPNQIAQQFAAPRGVEYKIG